MPLLWVNSMLIDAQVFQSEDTFGKLGKCLKYAFQACHALEKKGGRLSAEL
jgi:hypothetical protein